MLAETGPVSPFGRCIRKGERVERDREGDSASEGEHAIIVGEAGGSLRHFLDGDVVKYAGYTVDAIGDWAGNLAPEVDHVRGSNPTSRGGDHHDGEPFRRIRRMCEGDGVDETVAGHISQRVDDERRVEDIEGGLLGNPPEEAGPEQVEHAEQPLGGDESVGNHADDEGRDEGADGGGAVSEADLGAGEVQLPEIYGHSVIPTAPYEVMEEDHRG